MSNPPPKDLVPVKDLYGVPIDEAGYRYEGRRKVDGGGSVVQEYSGYALCHGEPPQEGPFIVVYTGRGQSADAFLAGWVLAAIHELASKVPST